MSASAKRPARKTARPVAKGYFSRESYNQMVEGLVAQGLERAEAVDVLRIGLRQANGMPPPRNMEESSPAPSAD